jgi:hypothetical protein
LRDAAHELALAARELMGVYSEYVRLFEELSQEAQERLARAFSRSQRPKNSK